MKKGILLWVFLWCAGGAYGQRYTNLVLNPHFEEFSRASCVTTANNGISEYTNWHNRGVVFRQRDGRLLGSSPDAYNSDTCGGHEQWNNHVPTNSMGYQAPHSGNGYIGFFYFNAREYVSGSLLRPLEIGKRYCAELHLSLGENVTNCGIKNLRMKLHTDSIFFVIPNTLSTQELHEIVNRHYDTIRPVVFYSDYVTDTAGWTKVTASFVADSAYRFFTLGDFKKIGDYDTIPIKHLGPWDSPETYLFVDDVAIFACDDTIPPPEPVFSFAVRAYPNPSAGVVHLDYTLPESGKIRLHISDAFGRLMLAPLELQGEKGTNSFSFDADRWAVGRYHLSVLYEGTGRSEYRHVKLQLMR
jgi:hypothetical protein